MHRLKLLFALLIISIVSAKSQTPPDTIVISNFATFIDTTLSQGVNVGNSSGYLILKTSEQEKSCQE